MANYWSYSKKKLTKKQIKEAHRLAKKLKKHEDKIKTPYALATYQIKKKYKVR
jgi:tRNA U34 5-methylaminomethyl-2-thiouridine-forming methyltransferase MnmC